MAMPRRRRVMVDGMRMRMKMRAGEELGDRWRKDSGLRTKS